MREISKRSSLVGKSHHTLA